MSVSGQSLSGSGSSVPTHAGIMSVNVLHSSQAPSLFQRLTEAVVDQCGGASHLLDSFEDDGEQKEQADKEEQMREEGKAMSPEMLRLAESLAAGIVSNKTTPTHKSWSMKMLVMRGVN